MTTLRTVLQPTQEIELDDDVARVLEHLGFAWNGTDDELAEHYRAAGLDLPPDIKPTQAAPAASGAGQSKSTSEQAKGA